jgi:hypothetical protein
LWSSSSSDQRLSSLWSSSSSDLQTVTIMELQQFWRETVIIVELQQFWPADCHHYGAHYSWLHQPLHWRTLTTQILNEGFQLSSSSCTSAVYSQTRHNIALKLLRCSRLNRMYSPPLCSSSPQLATSHSAACRLLCLYRRCPARLRWTSLCGSFQCSPVKPSHITTH